METIDFSATLVRDTDGAQTNVRTEEGRDVISGFPNVGLEEYKWLSHRGL